MGFGTGGMRRDDNLMHEMAREVQLMEYDRQHSGQENNPQKRKMGLIAFWCLLALLLLILSLFVFL